MKCITFILTLFLLFGCSPKEVVTKNKPNIIFIFADDQTYNSIGALGDQHVITPNLDSLVSSSTQFSNTFNMGGWNGAICIASRTMMLTGKYIWNAYQADSLMRINNYQLPLWSQLMEKGGYDTYMSGKWHIKKPAEEVFKTSKNIRPGMPNQTESGYNRPLFEGDTSWLPWDKSKEGFWSGGKHWSEVLADDALEFLDSSSISENPFFMYLAFNAPHDPRQSPKEFVNMYPVDEIEVPESFLEEYPYNEAMGSGRTLRDERLAPFPRTPYSVQVNRQEYYAIISHMDHQIGRIMEGIESSGEADNTYIIFAADHGLSVGHHGLLGKQNMYDHSIRVPLLISGPNIPKGEKISTDVYLQDLMPTALEIAQINKPNYIEFNSLLPLIMGEKEGGRTEIYGSYTMKQRMIRKDGFKLIAYPEAKKLRLFDLKNDPLEMNDLAGDSSYFLLKSELWSDLLRLQVEMNDPLTFGTDRFVLQ